MRGYYHIVSVHRAFDKYLSPASVDRVVRYNFGVDFYGVAGWKVLQYKIFPLYPLAGYWYKLGDHFDQMDKSSDVVDLFREHTRRIMEVADDEAFPLPATEPMFRILGRSSHAIMDVFSHSNLLEMLFDYYSSDPEAKRAAEASGKPLNKYIAEDAPLFSDLIDAPEHTAFREKYLPALFTLTSLPDEGPRSHEEKNLDSPGAKAARQADYPGIFEAVLGLSLRQVISTVDAFFSKIKEENPAKFELLTGAYRGPGQDASKPGPAEVRAKWVCDRLKVWM